MRTAHDSQSRSNSYTVPGMGMVESGLVIELLQERLYTLTDVALTLTHARWNVVGPNVVALHTVLDPQIEDVRRMVTVLAEQIATLGQSPGGTPGALIARRRWQDYPVGRADALEHLAALELVYTGVITDHRAAIDKTLDFEPVTRNILISQSGRLEQFHWLVRTQLERSDGSLRTAQHTTDLAVAHSPAG